MRALPPLLLAFAACVSAPAANAALYLVGGDPACTHASLQAALTAAAGNGQPDGVRVSRSAAYNGQALVANASEDLTIYGGFADCATATNDTTATTIDGGGGAAQPVMRITAAAGVTVVLDLLTLRNGDPSPLDGNGGGIRFEGAGELQLHRTAVINNTARHGGGIYANGTNQNARLLLGQGVTISGNDATGDGGGVFVNGMKFRMSEGNSIIAFNEALGQLGATGYGGGLVIRSTGGREAEGLVSSGGVGALGAIYGNTAKRGGGVAVSAGGDSTADAVLKLYSEATGNRAAIRGNFASELGGAIYGWPNQNFGSSGAVYIYAYDAELTDNAAPEGAAIYADYSETGELVEGANVILGTYPLDAGATCDASEDCVLIANNIAERADGTDTDGAVLVLEEDAHLETRRTAIVENQAGRVVDVRDTSGFGTSAWLYDSVVARNELRLHVARADAGESLVLQDSTLTDNGIATGPVIQAGSRNDVALRRSIVWQPGHQTISTGSGAPEVESVIASEVVSLDAGPNAIVAEPRFVDAPRGDYRLRASSPAVDFAPAITGDDRDFAGLPRDQDIGIVVRANPAHVRDIGAFERPTLLPILENGEFAGDANQWFLPVGHVGAYDNSNAPGSPGGSATTIATSAAQRVLGLAQCVYLPGAANYELNGYGASDGIGAGQANPTRLIWELRADGGDGCIDGPITQSGELLLSTTEAWNTAAQAARIAVPPSIWNHQTSLTVITATDRRPLNDDRFVGGFDRIQLVANGSLAEAIFKDSFEGPTSR